MNLFENYVARLAEIAWGPFTIIMLVGTGIYLSFGTRFVQFRKMKVAIKSLFEKNDDDEGDISPFQALMTSLAATIGTGNIVGVSSAIAIGGPGAVFWMWISGAIGGATRFAEAFLAIKYRETNDAGEKSGGPMYYIKNGIQDHYGVNMAWLGGAFAVFGLMASFGTGNMAQANSVSQSLEITFGINPVISGVVMAVLTAVVILGGVKNIGKVTEKIVPVMAIVYILGSLFAILSNYQYIPHVFGMIFSNAFTDKAVGGGVIGTVLRMGIARGVFSNEAGLGSAPIAHAASKNNNPVTEGLTASLSTFIATLVVCSMTAFVILASPVISMTAEGVMEIQGNLQGAVLTTTAFDSLLPGIGGYIVSFGLVFFAFSTILGWYYYGVKCAEFIAGVKITKIYTWAWIGLVFVGAIIPLEIVWGLSDLFNGLMALPNLIGLIALSPVVFAVLKEYEVDELKDKNNINTEIISSSEEAS